MARSFGRPAARDFYFARYLLDLFETANSRNFGEQVDRTKVGGQREIEPLPDGADIPDKWRAWLCIAEFRVQRRQRIGKPGEIFFGTRITQIEIIRCISRPVKARRNASNDDEVHLISCEGD
ncbi:MAG TPA: hypothetical protein VJN43_18190 [Bryobacteraceae bacterium]|nr:hypothetical protein [Bryobacteraceae bacterium]